MKPRALNHSPFEPGLSRMRTVIFTSGFLIVGVLIGLAGARFGEQVTVASLAPDEATRVWVVELPRFIDRNFAVRVEDLETGNLTTIFASPDEGRPVGSERIVWAADSSRFVLVGRHFYVHPEASLPSGESLYLLYDLRSGELWSNAAQQTELPTFSREDLAATQWRGALDARPPLSRLLLPAINFAGGHHEVLI